MSTLRRDLLKDTVRTSTGTKDYTSAQFSGVTPKAALIFVSQNTGLDEHTDGSRFGCGIYTPSGGAYFSGNAANGVSPIDTDSRIGSGSKVILDGDFGPVVLEGDVTFISGGVRINYTLVSGTAHRISILLLGGDGISNATLVADSTNQALSATNTIAAGHPVNVVIALATYSIVFGGNSGLRFSTGFAANDKSGTVTQGGSGTSDIDGVAPSNSDSVISHDRIISAVDGTAVVSAIQLDNFTATGFDENILVGAWNGSRAYLCLQLASDKDAQVQTFGTPLATGSRVISGLSHTPRVWINQFGNNNNLNAIHPEAVMQMQAAVENSSVFTHASALGVSVNNNDPSNTDSYTNQDFSSYRFGNLTNEFTITATADGEYTENYTFSNRDVDYSVLTIGDYGVSRVRDFMPFFADMI